MLLIILYIKIALESSFTLVYLTTCRIRGFKTSVYWNLDNVLYPEHFLQLKHIRCV